jgi:hypothetical protein
LFREFHACANGLGLLPLDLPDGFTGFEHFFDTISWHEEYAVVIRKD